MVLTLNELAYVGSLIKDQNDMSFFKNLKVSLKGDETKTLENKGLLKDGKLSGPLLEAALVLGKAHKTARIVMQVPGMVIEKGVFTLGAHQVLVETLGGEMSITFLQDLKEVNFEISDHVGMSLIKNTELSVMLEGNTLLVTLSLVDWVRQASLKSYLEGVSVPTETLSAFKKYLASPMPSSLTGLIAKLYGIAQPTAATFDAVVDQLVQKEMVKLEGDSLILNPDLQVFAMHFSIPDTQIVLEAFDGREPDTVIAASNIILYSGIKDILAFNATDEGVEMMAISSADLLNRVEGFLKCPDLK